jgi:hypothetical protein
MSIFRLAGAGAVFEPERSGCASSVSKSEDIAFVSEGTAGGSGGASRGMREPGTILSGRGARDLSADFVLEGCGAVVV